MSKLGGISFYSFWKPDQPPSGKEARCLSIGRFDEVVWKLGCLPGINSQAHVCGFDMADLVRLVWMKKVILQVRPDDGGYVFTIGVISGVRDEDFYRLYVLLWEHFNVLCYDEGTQDFVDLRQFKQRTRSNAK